MVYLIKIKVQFSCSDRKRRGNEATILCEFFDGVGTRVDNFPLSGCEDISVILTGRNVFVILTNKNQLIILLEI